MRLPSSATGTKTQDQFRIIFDAIQYKWAATATPAPNDYRQLIYFGDFFDELDAGQALTRWFGRNPDKAGDLQLLPHMEREFWMWVSSWALFIEKPSDLSDAYSDDGFEMPTSCALNGIASRLTIPKYGMLQTTPASISCRRYDRQRDAGCT